MGIISSIFEQFFEKKRVNFLQEVDVFFRLGARMANFTIYLRQLQKSLN